MLALFRAHGAAAGASALAVGWFFYLGYGATLSPWRISWLLRGDWAQAFWGLCFFRNASWSFPLGATPDLLWPFGTSIGFTDAIPWLALACKLISGLLPLDFQPFGSWFLLCFALQGWFGARITSVFSADPVQQALGGALFALTPVLPARNGHIALCSLFFVTAGVYLCLRPVESRTRALALLVGALPWLIWAAGTHAYLSAMLVALVLAYCARVAWCERWLAPAELALAVVVVAGSSLAAYWLLGYVGWKALAPAGGFGEFASDLSALINPQEWSRWARKLPYQERQAEGFAYLGSGVLALLVLRGLLFLRRPSAIWPGARRHWPLLLALSAMWIYSLSSSVRLNGREVLDLQPVYAQLSWLTQVFRSSGRFVWPLHIALIAAAVSACAALPMRGVARALLLAAVVSQAAELERKQLDFQPVELATLDAPVWQTLPDHYRHLALAPMHLKWNCRYDEALVHRVSYEAYRRGLTINSGSVARKELAVKALCKRELAAPVSLEPRTVYVLDRKHLRYFREHAVCGRIDGLLICVSDQRKTPLLEVLRRDPA
ncbi:MAG TPA: DUF6311 domain-containing protein [Polyangiales bacterium]|nr:DUF6311 domain-containing protein [Polyangiales bacterium]